MLEAFGCLGLIASGFGIIQLYHWFRRRVESDLRRQFGLELQADLYEALERQRNIIPIDRGRAHLRLVEAGSPDRVG